MNRSVFGAFFATALIAVSLAIPATAAEPSPEALKLSHDLLDATHAAQQGDQMTGRTMEMFSEALNEANPGRGPQIADLLNQVVGPEVRAAMPQMYDASARAFAANFSMDELKQLLAFYQSDIGRKFVERQPEIFRAQSEAMQSVMGRVEQKVAQAAQAKGLRLPQGF